MFGIDFFISIIRKRLSQIYTRRCRMYLLKINLHVARKVTQKYTTSSLLNKDYFFTRVASLAEIRYILINV
jgi:hypothetical protein